MPIGVLIRFVSATQVKLMSKVTSRLVPIGRSTSISSLVTGQRDQLANQEKRRLLSLAGAYSTCSLRRTQQLRINSQRIRFSKVNTKATKTTTFRSSSPLNSFNIRRCTQPIIVTSLNSTSGTTIQRTSSSQMTTCLRTTVDQQNLSILSWIRTCMWAETTGQEYVVIGTAQ